MKATIKLISGGSFETTITKEEVDHMTSNLNLRWITITEKDGDKIMINVNDIKYIHIT